MPQLIRESGKSQPIGELVLVVLIAAQEGGDKRYVDISLLASVCA
jgi:hypothetical protein